VASRASHPKVLLFGHHLAVLDGVEEGALACVAHIRIDGATPPAARHAAVLRFQQSAECRVALIAISAGGTALTLTAASHVVFLELYWTPAALLQAEDRVHRIGQTAARVQVTYLLGAGTLDEALWAALKRKSRVLGETLEGRAEACATTGVAGALSSSSSSAAAAAASATSTGLASGLLLAAGAVRRLDALGHVCDGATSRFFTAPATAPPPPARSPSAGAGCPLPAAPSPSTARAARAARPARTAPPAPPRRSPRSPLPRPPPRPLPRTHPFPLPVLGGEAATGDAATADARNLRSSRRRSWRTTAR